MRPGEPVTGDAVPAEHAQTEQIVEAAAVDDAVERRLVLLVVSTASLLTEELKRIAVPDAAGRRAVS